MAKVSITVHEFDLIDKALACFSEAESGDLSGPITANERKETKRTLARVRKLQSKLLSIFHP